MPVPVLERPLEQITLAHRRRTRLKRQFKCEIREAVRSNFIESFLLAADKASAPVSRSSTLGATKAMSPPLSGACEQRTTELPNGVDARAEMLRKSDDFLRQTLGL
jgi:hypothetical protein